MMSSLLVESIVALLSCTILLVLLTRGPPLSIKLSQSSREGTPRPGPSRERPIKPRTFRISSIPPDVTEGELRTYLKDLLEDCTPDDLIVSLAPYSYGKGQIATVTFTHRELSPFSECKTDERLYFQSDRMKSRIIVDCKFQGVTPLYSAREPTVEWVEVSLVRSYQELADHGM
jgi:RNA recognition motif-containing protein